MNISNHTIIMENKTEEQRKEYTVMVHLDSNTLIILNSIELKNHYNNIIEDIDERKSFDELIDAILYCQNLANQDNLTFNYGYYIELNDKQG